MMPLRYFINSRTQNWKNFFNSQSTIENSQFAGIPQIGHDPLVGFIYADDQWVDGVFLHIFPLAFRLRPGRLIRWGFETTSII
jgi:hypothetical protein